MAVRTSIVGSAVDGRVVEFFVNEGDAVRQGQPLARLRTETLEIELAAAEAELELRREQLAELENGSRPEDIEQAEARMAGAQALAEYSKAKYERIRGLFERRGTVTQEELQEAMSDSVQAEQAYIAARAEHKLAVLGPRAELKAQAKASVQVQEEQVRLNKDRIAQHTIVAPFDGYVTAERTEVGQWLKQGEAIAEIAQLDEVDVRASVLGDQVANIGLQTPARVDVSALPNEVFTGHVVLIVPQAEVRSRTFPVKVRVKNRIDGTGPLLKAGMLARVALPIGEPRMASLVSKDALVLGGVKPIVFVVDRASKQQTQGVVRSVPVDLGVANGNLIQVTGAVKPGDAVVVRGNERLQHGQAVSVAETIAVEGPSSGSPQTSQASTGAQ
jgi:RND family efflux transporter MFP subunit